MLIRALADVVMVNLALATGVVVNAFYVAATQPAAKRVLEIVADDFRGHFLSAVATSLIAFGAFYLSGFYTYGRAYRGRYKAAIVFQAVTSVFVLVGFLGYLLPGLIAIPVGALLTAGIVANILILFSRLWSMVWKQLAMAEVRSLPRGHDGVRNVLVIGGAGYVGSALLRKLLAKGYRVRLLDLFIYGDEPIADMIGHKNLEIIKADFRQVDKVVEALVGMDAVAHLGAIVGDPACALNEDFTIEVNLMATRLIAEVAKANGISRFVFASTCSVYGASDELLDEKSRLNPVSLYARSKIASEKVLQSMTDNRFRPTILRFGTVYGLSGRTRFDLVVNLLVAKAYADKKITVFGADQWRPFVHVEDTAAAVLAALEAPLSDVGGQIFNVGSDEQNKTLGMIGEMVQAAVPDAELVVSGNDGDRRNYRVNFGRIRNVLGFKPEYDLDKGIAQVLEAMRSGKVTDYQSAKYSNVKFLSADEAQHIVRTDNDWLRSLIDEVPEEPAPGPANLK